MLQRDWLMRQIEQAARMLGAIIAKVTSGQTIDVLGMFDQAYRPLLGVGSSALPYLSDEQLLDMLRPGGAPDDGRWPLLAKLLAVEADVHERRGARAEALARWRRAMMLLNEFGGVPQRESGLAAEVAMRLRDYRLRPATRIEVACLYEGAGRYADAEDTFFEGLDDEDLEGRPEPAGQGGAAAVAAGGQEALVDAAIAFYRRLLALHDQALVAGGLPRDEVRSALAELLARPVPPAVPAGTTGTDGADGTAGSVVPLRPDADLP